MQNTPRQIALFGRHTRIVTEQINAADPIDIVVQTPATNGSEPMTGPTEADDNAVPGLKLRRAFFVLDGGWTAD